MAILGFGKGLVPTKVSVLESEQRDHGLWMDPVSQDVPSSLMIRRVSLIRSMAIIMTA